MLTASNIGKAYAGRTLFGGLDFSITAGDRIALIGANGSGQNHAAGHPGRRNPGGYRNRIGAAQTSTVGYLKQEPASFAGRSLLDEVLDANPEAVAHISRRIADQRGVLASETNPEKQQCLDGKPRPVLTGSWKAPAETTGSIRPRRFSPAWDSRQPISPATMREFSGGLDYARRAGPPAVS